VPETETLSDFAPAPCPATGRLSVFAIFHLNLAYSSIEEDQRAEVIDRCYWPLLQVLRESATPLAIELTGYTLEEIARCDPDWIRELQRLLHAGACELIGSGYTQLIGPLVPAEVNVQNLRLGMECYLRVLGVKPVVALVNEQAFSAGMVRHYVDAGYGALVMEWDNPASQHGEWEKSVRYRVNYARGAGEEKIPLLWNYSIAFQQFQRYVHGENPLEDYLAFLRKHRHSGERVMALYGNDVEVFDFRPGRYHTEAQLHQGEWQRIAALLRALAAETGVALRLPRDILAQELRADAQELKLGSAVQPVPVKKQRKYNLSRWAITGRDDLWLNTACHRISASLRAAGAVADEDWRELCRLWASDLRTHITARRWDGAMAALDALARRLAVELPQGGADLAPLHGDALPCVATRNTQFRLEVDAERRRIRISTACVQIDLSLRRGMALYALAFAHHGFVPIIGTMPHGYFDSIELGADFYSAGTVIELPSEHRRITDLEPVAPRLVVESRALVVDGVVPTPLGPIHKRVRIAFDRPRVDYETAFPGWQRPRGTLRLGHITLRPDAFCGPLFYQTCHGGSTPERFLLQVNCLQDEPVSSLVSCATGLGATDGRLIMGDEQRQIVMQWQPQCCAAFPMIHHQASTPGSLTRAVFSLAELDETSRAGGRLLPFSLSLTPE
jgi:hypothetical protein